MRQRECSAYGILQALGTNSCSYSLRRFANDFYSIDIYPRTAEIGPGETIEVTIAYTPSKTDTGSCIEIDCYVSLVEMRDTQQEVTDLFFSPGWCEVLTVETYASLLSYI